MNKIDQVNFFKTKQIDALNAGISINAADTKVQSFKDTLGNMLGELNEVTQKPAQLTNDFFQGNADIHDVMAAIAQSEITVQAATTMTGKILQTYEKIMQIQI